MAEVNITFKGMSTSLESITVLLYDFSTKNENFLLSLLLLKSSSTLELSHKF